MPPSTCLRDCGLVSFALRITTLLLRYAVTVAVFSAAAASWQPRPHCFAVQPPSDSDHADFVTTITGDRYDSAIDTISNGIVSGPAIPAGTRLDDLLAIQTGQSVVVAKPNIAVYLSAGGVLHANAVAYADEKFSITTNSGIVNLNPDVIGGLLFKVTGDSSDFENQLADRSTEKDLIIAETASGQGSALGILESISDEKVHLNYDGQSRSIDISRIVGIVPADLKPEPLSGVIGSVKLTDGSTIVGQVLGLESGKLQLNLAGNVSITVGWADVANVSIRSDRVVHLSDLQPVEVEQNPLATVQFNWRRDLSVDGNPIRLRSPSQSKIIPFAKGLGTHAACRLEFVNEGDFDRFAAMVGIDAETGGNGDCEVSVWADGIQLWSQRITGRSEPVLADVDIAGMKRITLVVRNGEHLDLGDHVDWADARFIKTK